MTARDAAVVFAGACLAGVALAVGYHHLFPPVANWLVHRRKR